MRPRRGAFDPVGGLHVPEVGFHWNPPPPVPSLRDAPWSFPPPGSINFRGREDVVTGAGPVTVSIARASGSPDMMGVIRELQYGIAGLTPSTDVVFRLRVNGGPQEGFDFKFMPATLAAAIQNFDPPTTVIQVPAGAGIDVGVTVADIGSYRVSAFYRGWWYPMEYFTAWERRAA